MGHLVISEIYLRFLWWEAIESDEEPQFWFKKEKSSEESTKYSVKLDLGGEIVKGSGSSIELAKETVLNTELANCG